MLVLEVFQSPPPPETDDPLAPPDPAPESSGDLAQRQLCALERMAARCERVAEALECRLLRLADSMDGTPEEQAVTNAGINAASLGFDRANRAIRLALMLQTRIHDASLAALLKRREELAAKAAQRQAQIERRRSDVIEAVQDAVFAEDLARPDTQDRMDRSEDWMLSLTDEAVLAQSVGGMVEQIRTPVGLAFDPEWFEDENWATDERETHPPGSPYAVPHTLWRLRPRLLRAAAAEAATPDPEPHDRSP